MRLFVVLCVVLLSAASGLTSTAQSFTVEIRGKTTDVDRTPLPNVEVQIRKFDRVPIIRTRSGADGTFRFLGLTPGTYRVIATTKQETAIHEAITIPAGSSVNLALHLERTPICPLAPVEGTGTVRGRVTDWLGEPAPAFLWLESSDQTRDRRLSSRLDGRYEIDLVPTGPYRLHVWVPGLEPTVTPIEITSNTTVTADLRMELRLPTNDASDSNRASPERLLSAQAPPLATGFGGISGLVTDISGGHIPGATVSVRTGASRPIEVITDRFALFWFPNLAPGRYEVRASLTGFKTSVNTVVVAAGRWSNGAAALEIGDLELPPDERDIRWKRKRSELLVGITTNLGEIMMAIAPRNEFFACVERGAYTAGRLEAMPRGEGQAPLFRIVNGPSMPAAHDATVYGLQLDESPRLVILEGPGGYYGQPEGRMLEGSDVIDKIRERLKSTNASPLVIEILSINRLITL